MNQGARPKLFCSLVVIGILLVGIALPYEVGADVPNQVADDTKGAWRERSQLVWDSRRKDLVRKLLRVWDPDNDRRLEFYWERDVQSQQAAGPVISGSGKLTWRIKGTARYDASGVVRTYSGRLRAGRPHGRGRLEVRDGLMYEGEWLNGVMHGKGEIRYPDGGHYVGAFRNGKPNGKGRFAYANGEIHEGSFRQGLSEGPGKRTLADGREVKSIWKAGLEKLGRSAVIPVSWDQSKIEFAQWAGSGDRISGVTISTVVDRRRNQAFKSSQQYLTYTQRALPQVTLVYPDDDKLMKLLTGKQTMQHSSIISDRFVSFRLPVHMNLSIANRSRKTLSIKSIELEVLRSAVDRRPYLEFSSGGVDGECMMNAGPLDAKVRLMNFGWGPAQNANLRFGFFNGDQTYRAKVGTITQDRTVDLIDAVRKTGADINRLSSKNLFKCPSYNQIQRCRRDLLKRLRLGSLARLVRFNETFGTNLIVDTYGRLSYQWTDVDGTARRSGVSVKFPLRLTSIKVQPPAECGAGGPEDPQARVPVLRLRNGKQNYRVRYPLRRRLQVRAGRMVTLPFALKARKASDHRYRVVVEMSDGKRLATKPVRLKYFEPRYPGAR